MSAEDSKHTTAERITLGMSLLILVGIIGLAGYSNMRNGDQLPTISVEAHMADIRQTESGYYVPITITNDGGLTAQDVIITGELVLAEGEPETAEVTIAFLSGGESENAEMVFSSHPDEGDFTVRTTSYIHP